MMGMSERKVDKTCREFGHDMRGERTATVTAVLVGNGSRWGQFSTHCLGCLLAMYYGEKPRIYRREIKAGIHMQSRVSI